MASGALEEALTGRELAFMRYTRLLTLTPGDVSAADIEAMRAAGASDGEILEVNQCVALFNYSNRSLSGLGVQVGDDRVGYY